MKKYPCAPLVEQSRARVENVKENKSSSEAELDLARTIVKLCDEIDFRILPLLSMHEELIGQHMSWMEDKLAEVEKIEKKLG